MENNFPRLTATLLELEQLTNCKLQPRRRYRRRYIIDDIDDEYIPFLGTAQKEQESARCPSLPEKMTSNKVIPSTEEFEMISSHNLSTWSLPLSAEGYLREDDTVQTEKDVDDEHEVMIDLPAMESTEDFEQDLPAHNNLNKSPKQRNSEYLTDSEPSDSKTSISTPAFFTPNTSLRRAYSLSNAVADLRELPWHIDHSQNRNTVSLCFSNDETTKEDLTETPTHHYRHGPRNLLQRIRRRLKLVKTVSPGKNRQSKTPGIAGDSHQIEKSGRREDEDVDTPPARARAVTSSSAGSWAHIRGDSVDRGIGE